MEVKILTKDLYTDYTEFLNSHPHKLLYYTIEYKEFICELLKCSSHYLLAVTNNEINGILPLMIKDGPFGKVLNSLPYYGSHGGVLSNCNKARKALYSELENLLVNEKICSSVIIQNLFENNISLLENLGNERDSRIGQITPLNSPYSNIEEILKLYHSKTRNMVKKAIKSGIDVKIENDQLAFLQSIHYENMSIINGKPKSRLFFELLPKYFKPQIDFNLYIARKNNIPVAGLLLFYSGETVEYFMPVIKHEYRSYQPLSFIIAKSMLDSSQNKFKFWNWGGTWKSQEGVYRFKSRWGTIDYPYSYSVRINNDRIYYSSREILEKAYEGFYVIPYNKLKS